MLVRANLRFHDQSLSGNSQRISENNQKISEISVKSPILFDFQGHPLEVQLIHSTQAPRRRLNANSIDSDPKGRPDGQQNLRTLGMPMVQNAS